MNRAKILAMLCLAFMFFGCSDSDSGNSAHNLGDTVLPTTPSKGKKAKAAGLTSDGHDLLVWTEGDLDAVLIKIDTIQITDSSFDGIAYFKGLREGEIPEAGDIINSAITKNAPYGFLYKAVEVSTEDDITAVRIEYASIEDAVENAEVEQEIELGFDEEGNLQRVLQKSISKNFEFGVVSNVGNWGTIDANISYTVTLKIEVNVGFFKLKYAEMSIKQVRQLKRFDLDLEGSVSRGESFDMGKISLPKINFWVGPVYVDITPQLIAKSKIDASAELKINTHFDVKDSSKYGFYYNGSFHVINESGTERNFNFKHSIAGKVKFSVLAGINLSFYGGAGNFSVMAGPGLELSASRKFAGNSVYDFKTEGEREKVKLNLGADMEMEVKIRAFSKTLFSRTIAEGFKVITNLKEARLLPSFDSPQVSYIRENGIRTGITISSAIKKSDFGYEIEDYGFCLEEKGGNDKCVNGSGIRKSFGEISDNIKHDIPVSFGNLKPGEYSIYPYFKSGIGTHYDRAKNFLFESSTPDLETVFLSSNSNINLSSSSGFNIGSSSSSSNIDDIGLIDGDGGYSYEYIKITDSRDKQQYEAVKIANKTWMMENLNYNASGSKCYDDDLNNCYIYGRLYNWSSAKNACPSGWHLPTDAEWDELKLSVGGTIISNSTRKDTTASKNLRAKSWSDGENKYGFNALPGGWYEYIPIMVKCLNIEYSYYFYGKGSYGRWWSATDFTDNDSYKWPSEECYQKQPSAVAISFDLERGDAGWHPAEKTNLFSVRCVQN